MKRNMRRITAVLLVVWMLMTMLPFSASAGTRTVKKYDLSRCPVCGEKRGWDPIGDDCEEPTCTQKGYIRGYCSGKCSDRNDGEETISEAVVAALGHDWGKKTVIKESTCSVKGSYKHTCKRCGKTETEESDLKPHTWGEWTIVNEAADFSVGLREHTCEKCKKTKQEEYYPEGTLKSGDKGDAVKELQELLNENGNDCGKADGSFGKKTTAAVAAFETANGLEADGIAWPGVQALLAGVSINGEEEEPADYYFTKTAFDVDMEPCDVFAEGDAINWVFRVVNALSGPEEEACMKNVLLTDPMLDIEYDMGDIPYGGAAEYTYISDIDADDAMAGYISNIATVTWLGADGEEHSMEAECTVTITEGDIIFRKSEVSTPENGSYYVEGEKITYGFELTNNREIAPGYEELYTGPAMLDVKLYDWLFVTEEVDYDPEDPDPDAPALLAEYKKIAAGETVSTTAEYTVTADDVERGFIENEAYLMWMPEVTEPDQWGPAYIPSNTVTVWTGTPMEGPGTLLLEKYVDNDPENGEYFVEGEQIDYKLVVMNTTGEDVLDVEISDPLKGGNEDSIVDRVECIVPHGTYVCDFLYTVTAEDAEKGIILNTASVMWTGGSAESNPVETPVGTELPEEDDDGIVFTKTELSKPLNGLYYTVGEIVEYAFRFENNLTPPTEDDFDYSMLGIYDLRLYDPAIAPEEGDEKLNSAYGDVCIAHRDVLEAGDVFEATVSYIVTEEDAERGYIRNVAFMTWHSAYPDDPAEYYSYSNEVLVPVEPIEGSSEDEEDDPRDLAEGDIVLEKYVTARPANGEYYTEGEEIVFYLRITNNVEDTIWDVEITDPIRGSAEDMIVDHLEGLDGGESYETGFGYTVTAGDVEAGEIRNTAYAFWDGGDTESEELVLPTRPGEDEEEPEYPEEGETDDLYWIEKYVIGGPANKEYYVEGETVRYGVTAYNYAYWASASVTVYDPIFGDDERIIGEGSIESNGSMDIIFPYTVTAEDVETGYIVNQVYMEATPVVAEGYDPEEWEDRMGTRTIWSNEVTVQVGEGEPVKDGSVTLTKEIVNDPVNGDYFMETEEIEYRIVLKNGTEGTIRDVTITDPLKGGNEDAVVDYFESVGPGESAEATYIHKVTADDVDQSEIRNTAYASWIVATEDPDVWDEGETQSGEVIADTGCEVIEEPEPVEMDRKITDTAYVGEAYDRNFDLADYIDGNDFREIRWVPEGSALYEIGLASYEDEERMIHIYGTPDTAGVVSNYYEYKIDGILFHVEIEITVLEEGDGDEGDEEFPLSITKECISTPWYTGGYIEGEAVEYRVTVSNISDMDITQVTVTDPLAPEDYKPDVIPAGGSVKYEYTYYVTDWDAEQGSIGNIAELYWQIDEDQEISMPSDPVVVKTQILTPPEPGDDPIPKSAREFSIEKELDGEPKNGSFYTPGEKVKYKLIVRNDTDQTYEGAWAGDSLEVGSPWFKELGTLEPGYYLEIPYEYEVKEEDLGSDILINIGMLTGVDETGVPQEVWSGRVIVEIGPGLVPPVTGENTPAPRNTPKPPEKEELHPSLTITKEVKSEPDNGSYYTEGEKIEYEITYKNTGDIDLGETVIWDVLDTTEPIGKVPNLKTGEEKTIKYEYTVQAGDIGTWVVNVAFAEYEANGVICVAMSNEVESPTGEDPEPPEKRIGPMGRKEAPCSRTVTENGEDYGIYEVHYCDVHGPTEDAVKLLTEAANTPEAEQKAWEYAAGLWKKDIDEMFDAVTKAASGPAKAVVFRERLLFCAQAASRGSLLKALYPEEPERAVREIAEMYMNKCVDLCYELSTAPGARADDPVGAEKCGWSGDTAAECTHMILSDTGRDVEYQESYCAAHTTTHQLSNALLEGSADPEASWKQIGALWEMELEKGYAILVSAPEEELSTIAAADRKLYGEWLEAREEYLRILYAGEDAIVEQMLAKAMTDRVMENCELDTDQ